MGISQRFFPVLKELSVDIVELFADLSVMGEETDVPHEEQEDDYSE